MRYQGRFSAQRDLRTLGMGYTPWMWMWMWMDLVRLAWMNGNPSHNRRAESVEIRVGVVGLNIPYHFDQRSFRRIIIPYHILHFTPHIQLSADHSPPSASSLQPLAQLSLYGSAISLGIELAVSRVSTSIHRSLKSFADSCSAPAIALADHFVRGTTGRMRTWAFVTELEAGMAWQYRGPGEFGAHIILARVAINAMGA
jgi:hypothetical protein